VARKRQGKGHHREERRREGERTSREERGESR
jgi:hypothetical protein